MTEASPVITGIYPNEDDNFGSIGRPIPNTECKVRICRYFMQSRNFLR